MENDGYAKFFFGGGGGDKVHYGKCGSGMCNICAVSINQYCYSFKIFLHL